MQLVLVNMEDMQWAANFDMDSDSRLVTFQMEVACWRWWPKQATWDAVVGSTAEANGDDDYSQNYLAATIMFICNLYDQLP